MPVLLYNHFPPFIQQTTKASSAESHLKSVLAFLAGGFCSPPVIHSHNSISLSACAGCEAALVEAYYV